MSTVYGNVNVNYKPCKSMGQLKAADNYMLGKMKCQIAEGITKTHPHLYDAIGCNRDNFSSSLLVTRKMHHKSYSKLKPKDILAHKMSISFHPKDNDNLSYEQAFAIGQEFALKFFGQRGFEVLFAVHTDTDHAHIHFLISNCNLHSGKSFRRNKQDLIEMSEFFGYQCLCHGLNHSVRDTFYSENRTRDKLTFAEHQIRQKGGETFKDELREVIRLEVDNPENQSFQDVLSALCRKYGVETRVAGNTISYRHPEYKDKKGNLISVRASKLGDFYTRRGITHELSKSAYWKNRNTGKELKEPIGVERDEDNRATELLPKTAGGNQCDDGTKIQNRVDRNRNTSANFRYATGKQRTSSNESTISSTAGTGGGLQKTLSEIRGYNSQFNPGQPGQKQFSTERTIGENKNTTDHKSVTAKSGRKRNKPHSR
ncbi:MAG: relaxase/mobilization nuclease domain-containing protein [Lachnospiraceae bacterium]